MMTFGECVLTIINSKFWEDLTPEQVCQFAALLRCRLEDFVAVAFCKVDRFGDLFNADEGMIQLAAIFGSDVLTDARVMARYELARSQHDDGFLVPFGEAMRKPGALHAASEAMFKPRFILFMNWDLPLLYPSLQPLSTLTNKQLSEFLQPLVDWDENRIKKELHTMRLRRVTQNSKIE